MPRQSLRRLTPQDHTHAANLSQAWTQAIVLSNRGPVSHEVDASGSISRRRSSGGLVTALDPLVQACSATWVACGTQACDAQAAALSGLDIRSTTTRYRMRHVCLSEDEYRGYYYGFANEGLWPLCHAVSVQPVFRPGDFRAYRSANIRFAAAVAAEAACPDPLLLVQDYHFALAPRDLRRRIPLSTIVAFWHIPWPPLHVLRVCPWAAELLDGLLGADIAGFQTPADCTHFLNSAELILGADVDHDSGIVTYRDRDTLVRAYPVGVEWNNETVQAAPPVSVCRDRVRRELGLPTDIKLGVGIDRLDYTKGIHEKFLAIERALERNPDLRGRLAFVQVAEPSRDCLPEYRSARHQLVATAQRVNERFGTGTTQPIVLRESHHEADEVYRLYRAADFCHVGSLRDGMNLVAKEFVCARDDEKGVLVLSEFTGAAQQMPDALLINPWDVQSSSGAIVRALAMPQTEQTNRMRRLRRSVAEFDAGWWARGILSDAASVRNQTHDTERATETTPLSAAS
jgi:trehalose 6-phosphate synthase